MVPTVPEQTPQLSWGGGGGCGAVTIKVYYYSICQKNHNKYGIGRNQQSLKKTESQSSAYPKSTWFAGKGNVWSHHLSIPTSLYPFPELSSSFSLVFCIQHSCTISKMKAVRCESFDTLPNVFHLLPGKLLLIECRTLYVLTLPVFT